MNPEASLVPLESLDYQLRGLMQVVRPPEVGDEKRLLPEI